MDNINRPRQQVRQNQQVENSNIKPVKPGQTKQRQQGNTQGNLNGQQVNRQGNVNTQGNVNIKKPVRPTQHQQPVRTEKNKQESSKQSNIQQKKFNTQGNVNIQKPVRPTQHQQPVRTEKNKQESSKQSNIQQEKFNTQSKVRTEQNQQRQQESLSQQQTRQPAQNQQIKAQEQFGKLTRLQKEARGIESKPVEMSKRNSSRDLCEQRDYNLINTNKKSFEVKKVKRSGIGFLIIPIVFIVILCTIITALLSSVIKSVKDMKINTTSLLNSTPIEKEEFIQAVEKIGLQVNMKELGGGINEVMAYTEDYSYEINYITFESNEDTQAYYNYIIDIADEIESSVSSSIVGQNSAETTLISKTYNGFMDITYIDTTIIIAIAYDSNKQTSVIEFMNNLGY